MSVSRKLKDPFSIRFPTELRRRVQAVAEAAGVKPADIVRLCVQMQIDEVAKTGCFAIRGLADAAKPRDEAG